MGTTELALPDGYERVLADVKKAVAAANLRAMRTANTEMLRLYWTIGRAILEQQDQEGWGAKVIGRLAKDLRDAYPGLTGLSRTNLEYMRRYAAAYRSAPIPQQPAGALPWGHVMVLLDKFDSPELRDWYAAQAVDNGWSRAVLLHQIDNLLHTRLGAAPSNFPVTLSGDTDLAQQLTKDPFILDFLDVDGRISERQLEDALIHRLERFMLELGRGFSFVGRQVRLNVGGDEYFIDLLFFHIPTLRYVVLELKIEKFKPEHLGQLDFYVKVVDDQYRTPVKHAETVGILLCPDKNDVVVEYAIRGRMTPLTVNRYALTGLTPDEEAALPSPAALKEALRTPAPDERQQRRFSDAFPGWQDAPAPSE